MNRKPKEIGKLMEDPQFPFMVGRLMGASEMAAHWMMTHSDEEQRNIGHKLLNVVDWFFTDDERAIPSLALPKARTAPSPSPSEADTEIILPEAEIQRRR